jgi:hypothetical protein
MDFMVIDDYLVFAVFCLSVAGADDDMQASNA